MKILLIGYGKMGRMIEEIALDKKHTISYVITSTNKELLKQINRKEVDVALEFTKPDSAFDNIHACIEKNIPVVCGTTGWIEKKPQIETFCRKRNATFFYSSNYSVAMNILFKINELLAKLMSNYTEFEISIKEKHHSRKLDAPSGSAITLAHGITANHSIKNKWQLFQNNIISQPDIINIESIRKGNITGEHYVRYHSSNEELQIGHKAIDRRCFAAGALLSAEFCLTNSGVLSMDDLLFK